MWDMWDIMHARRACCVSRPSRYLGRCVLSSRVYPREGGAVCYLKKILYISVCYYRIK